MYSIDKRPKTFSEVVGQPNIIKEFKILSRDLSFSNYILLYGDSGTGKSTSAFIISKLLQCKNPVKNEEGYYDPCNECSSCKDINQSKFARDVHYFDASTMGKEEVNKLNSRIASAPLRDKNKIIIIDEAHLLNSKEARGAMLLMLEKPRKNVYFILSTTDISKFDKAFLSRLKKYKFKGLNNQEIGQYLISIFNSLGIDPDNDPEIREEDLKDFLEKGLFTIIENSGGSAREAVMIFERCIQGKIFRNEDIVSELDIQDTNEMSDVLIGILYQKNPQEIYKYLQSTDDLEFFYNFVVKIMIETRMYEITKIPPIAYREKTYKSMTSSKDFNDFYNSIKEFESSRQSFYFNKRLFTMMVINFINNHKEPEVKVRQRKRLNESN